MKIYHVITLLRKERAQVRTLATNASTTTALLNHINPARKTNQTLLHLRGKEPVVQPQGRRKTSRS
jgi:hypothetical protein